VLSCSEIISPNTPLLSSSHDTIKKQNSLAHRTTDSGSNRRDSLPLGDDEQDSSAVLDAIFQSLAYKRKRQQNIYSFILFSFLVSL
jgi:hypothetical protein